MDSGDQNIDELRLDDNDDNYENDDENDANNEAARFKKNRLGLKIGNFKQLAFGFFKKSNHSNDHSMGELG